MSSAWFLNSLIPVVVVDCNKTAVVESAGTEMLNEFELTLTEFFFKALSVFDLNVSVDGNDDNCKVA